MSSTTSRPIRMNHPPYPGEVLRGLYLVPNGLTVHEVAKAIGVSRTALSQMVNGHARVSLAMALRLGAAFRTSPEVWLNLQHEYDLWHARKNKIRVHVRPLIAKHRAAG